LLQRLRDLAALGCRFNLNDLDWETWEQLRVYESCRNDWLDWQRKQK